MVTQKKISDTDSLRSDSEMSSPLLVVMFALSHIAEEMWDDLGEGRRTGAGRVDHSRPVEV